MSNSKETKTQKVLPGEEPMIHPKYDHKLIKVPAAARVEIHAASVPSVNDTLVLRSTEGTTKGECTYWKERKVQNASQSDGFLNLSFSPGRNDGTAERARTDRRYALAWRPAGKAEAEVLLFEDRAYEETWKTGPDDAPDKIAELMAARFEESADVILSDRRPAVLWGLDVPRPIREKKEAVPDAGGPLPFDEPMPDPERAQPMKARSGSAGKGTGEGKSGGTGGSLPPGPRWITLLRWEKGVPQFLAAYEVTQSGKYKLASVEGEGPASAVGSAQSDVLLPLDPHAETDVMARLSMVPPTKKRIEQQAARIRPTIEKRNDVFEEAPGHSYVPLKIGAVLGLDRPSGEHAQLEAPSESETGGPGGTVRLPNPLAAAERRLGRAKNAHKRISDWKAKVKDTVGLTGLVGGTCLNESVGRTYLKRALRDRPPSEERGPEERAQEILAEAKGSESTNSESEAEWGEDFLQRPAFISEDNGPFDPAITDGAVEGSTDTMLGAVLHDHQCQWAYLSHRRDRALRAARAVFETVMFEDLLYDVAVLKKGKDEGGVAQSIVETVDHATNLGEGGAMAAALCEEGAMDGTASSALSSLMKGQKGVLAPEGPTQAPVLKALVKLAQRSKGGLKELAVNAAPAILAVGARRNDLTTEADAPASLALLGAFLTAEGSGGSVSVQTRPGPDGHKTMTVQGGSTATFVQRRVQGLDHRREEDQTRWSVKNVGGLSSVTVGAGGAPKDALELSVAGVMIHDRPESGALNVKDAFGSAKTAVDIVDTASDIPYLGNVVTAVEVAWNTIGALGEERWQGAQKIDDPQYIKALGTLVKFVAGELIAKKMKHIPVIGLLVDRVVGAGLDQGVGWAVQWANVDEDASDDPLIEKDEEAGTWTRGWLAEESHWGLHYDGSPAARDALATLMKPGKDKGSAPPAKPFRDQTKQFAQEAFSFPTKVGVPPRPDAENESSAGPPERLYLSIIPEYLPTARGTLMVDLGVQELDERGQAVGDEAPLQFSVHYVKTGNTLRYCERLGEVGLQIPPNVTLAELAEHQKWAEMETGTPASGMGEKEYFPIHIGPWPNDYTSMAEKYRARMDVDASDRENMPVGTFLAEGVFGMEGWDQRLERQAERAKRQVRKVSPQTVVPGSNVIPILQSGRFQVEGFISFSPLQPFQPSPEIPEGHPQNSDRMLAWSQINYEH